jgi:hypothetical protein
MATKHKLSDILLGQAGGSEFGVIGNVKEFVEWFYAKYSYVLRAPIAYIKASYIGGQSQHKLDVLAYGYLVLCVDRLVFFSKIPKFIIEIPLSAINWDLMFVEAKGFSRLALTARDKDKFLKILENVEITKESKKILQNLPEEIASLTRQRYSKRDINYFTESVINLALILQKKTLQIPYMSYWGLEKPKFWLGITSPGLSEFVYAWAKLMLRT